MSNNLKTKVMVLIMATFWWPGFILAASNAPETIKTAVSSLNDSIDRLVEAKDEITSTAKKEDKPAIDAFYEILKLSFVEVDDLIKRLDSLNNGNLDADELLIKERFLNDLKNYQNYYRNIENDIKGGLSPEELRSLAQDLKDWRKDHQPKLQKIFDFLLIDQSENLYKVARNRWDKISKDLGKIKKAGFPINNLQILSEKSKTNVDQANHFTAIAAEEFIKTWKLENSTSTDENSKEIMPSVVSSSKKDERPANINSVRINLQKSLINIKTAYQVFFEMNNIVKTLLK